MMHWSLPTSEELSLLGEPCRSAVTVYVPTSPTVEGRAHAFTAAKSGVDEGLRRLRAAGAPEPDLRAIADEWAVVAADEQLWGKLSNSLAIFLSPEISEDYVLANNFDTQTHAGGYFQLGQLMRAYTQPQSAFALTLAVDGWNLWEATPEQRVSELPMIGEHAVDAADATNRATIRGRQYMRRIGGDEGRKTLLDRYAQVVREAVRSELGAVDPKNERVLFLFAAEPLLSLFRSEELPRQVVAVPGAPDALRPDQIDEVIRQRIGEVVAAERSAEAESIGDGFAAGLASTDLAHIAKAAARGAVDTFVFDFTTQVPGMLDEATGQIVYDPAGSDLMCRVALVVLRKGGRVWAVRPNEISAGVWNGSTLARLRHRLA